MTATAAPLQPARAPDDALRPAHGFVALNVQSLRGGLVGCHVEDEGCVYLIDDWGMAQCDECGMRWVLSIIWRVEKV